MITRIIPALMALVCLVSCSPEKVETAAYDTSRVVVLGGAVGETVFALGEGGKVIAADLSCTYPPEIVKLPRIGYHRQISPEGILALKPTLILATDVAGPPAAIELLKGSGVPLVILPHTPTAEITLANIRNLAGILGVGEKGEALVKKVEGELAAVAPPADNASTNKPKVLFLMGAPSAERLNAAGRKTAAEEIIRLAGGQLVFTDFENYKAVSPESIAAAAPDVIFFPGAGTHGGDFSDEWTKIPALAQTPAIREGRVYPVDLGLVAGFGPRLGEAAAEVHKMLYKK